MKQQQQTDTSHPLPGDSLELALHLLDTAIARLERRDGSSDPFVVNLRQQATRVRWL